MTLLGSLAAAAATAAAAITLSASDAAAQPADVRALLTQPIGIERAEPVASVPLEVRGGKLFIQATVNGQPREFFFDSGSPTILTRELADSLGLKIAGRNTGVDANGTPVTMDIAVVDSLTIGGTTFSNVPVLIHDYTGLDSGACLVDGGFIGSELLPGSAWRIDTAEGRLSIAESAAALVRSKPAVEARLYDFGYPHAPVVDYALGDVPDKALFDTGSSEVVTLYRKVAENPSVRAAIAPGSTRRGRGYEGESAGGRGERSQLVKFTLGDFQIDGQELGPVGATTRAVPPSLVGAGILASYVVTLDYPGKRFVMERRSEPVSRRPHGGYTVAFVSDHAVVVQLYEDAPAAKAGLWLGDRVTEIAGRSLVVTPDNRKCDTVRWLVTEFDPAREAVVTVVRKDGPRTLHIPAVRDAEPAVAD